ncbi:Aly/REF export factor 2 [Colletotrichum spinosum]|uniref:Aly/REF export factor 2 n=1 Tax=Colletotrichum spinosum TaxID=1347390 RepID=A0A4R8PUC7_9PEZI|nr:Aly/REF export factor 2 [Colletotrichum spinosum]
MADRMDRSLDEILAEKKNNGPRNRHGGGGGGGGAPRRLNGFMIVSKNTIHAADPLGEDAIHPRRDTTSAKLRVENIHYELTAEDLEELFTRIGPVAKLDLKYDRAGRSEGIAFITMQSHEDAQEAIKEFDGANANGQPIRLTLLTGGRNPRSRNPFDSAVMPGRPLSERISAPGGRSRSLSPGRRYDVDEAASRGIDRYVPGNRSRSPMPRRRGGGGGRRPGARREGGRDGGRESGRDQDGGRGGRGAGRDGRARKTQEELDAEMADYFGGGNSEQAAPQANGGSEATQAAAAPTDDIDMIE